MDITKKPPTVAKRGAEARRECIISAARVLIAQHGFHGTGMAQIARSSGVLVGQIYRDFASKEDLIAAIVERDVANFMHDPELRGDTLVDEAEQLNRWVRRFIGRKIDKETRGIFADILSESTRNAKISAIIVSAHNRMRDCIARTAIVWTADPAKADARENIADLILTAAGGIQHRQVLGLECDDACIARVTDLVDLEIAKLRRDA